MPEYVKKFVKNAVNSMQMPPMMGFPQPGPPGQFMGGRPPPPRPPASRTPSDGPASSGPSPGPPPYFPGTNPARALRNLQYAAQCLRFFC